MPNSSLWIPQNLRAARKIIKVIFYYSKKIDRIEVGFPEQFPVPPVMAQMGFEKIVCETAHDVERWSEKKRKQDQRDREMSDEQREQMEGPIRSKIRSDLVQRMLAAKDKVNYQFCKFAIERLDAAEREKQKEKFESYMHAEAAEDGH